MVLVSTDEMCCPSPHSLARGVAGGSPGRVLEQPPANTVRSASATGSAEQALKRRVKAGLRAGTYHRRGQGSAQLPGRVAPGVVTRGWGRAPSSRTSAL